TTGAVLPVLSELAVLVLLLRAHLPPDIVRRSTSQLCMLNAPHIQNSSSSALHNALRPAPRTLNIVHPEHCAPVAPSTFSSRSPCRTAPVAPGGPAAPVAPT